MTERKRGEVFALPRFSVWLAAMTWQRQLGRNVMGSLRRNASQASWPAYPKQPANTFLVRAAPKVARTRTETYWRHALLHHRAGQPVAGIAGGLAAIVVRMHMDHQGPAAKGGSPVVEGHEAVEDLGAQGSIGTDILVRHVAGMRAIGSEEAVLGILIFAGKMLSRRLEPVLGIAAPHFVSVKSHPGILRQAAYLHLDQHALAACRQSGPADVRAVLAHELGRRRLRGLLCRSGTRHSCRTGDRNHRSHHRSSPSHSRVDRRQRAAAGVVPQKRG